MNAQELEMNKELNSKSEYKDLSELKILVVDDDKEDILYLSELLEESFKEKANLKIETARNFSEAVNKITENKFDLVILDFQLGYLNGLDIQAIIKEENPSLPVVFVTGQGNEKIAVRALKEGAVDYLVKDELTTEIIYDLLQKVFLKQGKDLINKTRKLFMKSESSSIEFQQCLISFDSLVRLRLKFKEKFLSKSMPFIKETMPMLQFFDFIRTLVKR